jgi:hypothetical protein
LRDVFIGSIDYWHDFDKQVTDFYKAPTLQNAFQRCSTIGTSIDLESIKKKWKHFAILEHTLIGEERDLHARFLNNAVDHVLETTKTLCDAENGPETEVVLLKGYISHDMNAGFAKVVPKEARPHGEPDIVFNIPGEGALQEVCVVGELKFFVTCSLSEHFDPKTGRVTPEKEASQAKGSLRHMLGKFTLAHRSSCIAY